MDEIKRWLAKDKVKMAVAGLAFQLFGEKIGLDAPQVQAIVYAIMALFVGHTVTDAAASAGAANGKS